MPQPADTSANAASELKKLTQEMEFVTRAFLGEAEKFVRSWYWRCAEFYVTKYYDHTRELGPGALAQMKNQIKRVDENTQGFVNRLIGAAKFWTHRSQGDQWSNVDLAKGAPKEILAAVATVTNEIKPVLRQHGYLPASDRFDSDVPDPNEWPETLLTLTDRYRSLVRKGLFLRTELRAAEEENKRLEARNLWKNA